MLSFMVVDGLCFVLFLFWRNIVVYAGFVIFEGSVGAGGLL